MSFSHVPVLSREMGVETRIRRGDQPTVEASAADTRLVACHEQDRLPPAVEGEGHAPHAPSRVETQLLHVGVPRPLQSIDPRASESRSEAFDDLRLRQQLDLHRGRKSGEFGVEVRCEADRPRIGPI